MGKRKHRDPAERAAREARRQARADRSIHRKVVEIAAAEYMNRLRHDLTLAGANPDDLVKLDAFGLALAHKRTIGTPENWPTIDTDTATTSSANSARISRSNSATETTPVS